MDKHVSSVAALADKLNRLKMNNNLLEPKETKLSEHSKKTSNIDEDSITEAYSLSQMSLPNNDQTWLYCEDESKINVVMDLKEFLTIRPISHNAISTDKALAGGGIDTRTFVRPKKQIQKQFSKAAVNNYDKISCDETNNQDSWASLETNVKNSPGLQPIRNRVGGVSSIGTEGSFLKESAKQNLPIQPKKEQNCINLNCTFDYNQNSKSENQNQKYVSDAQGDVMNVKSPQFLEDVTTIGYENVTALLNSTFSKGSDVDSLGQKLTERDNVTLTQQFLEDITCPLNESATVGLNSTYDKVIDLNTSPKLIEEKEVNSGTDRSSYSSTNTSPEDRDNAVFHPLSESTPTRNKHLKQNINKAMVTEIDYNVSSDDTLCDSQHNISLPIDTTVIGSLEGRNMPILSKSDPSILDSLEGSGRTYENGTPVKSDRRQSLYNSKRMEQSKINTTFQKKSGIGQLSEENKFGQAIVFDHEEDSTSSTSDSSYKSCLSSKRTHLRSLGDVRTLARQQEESLRLQPENQLKSKQLQSNSGIVRSHEFIPSLKKVMSEDVIYPSSSENYGLSRIARTSKSAHSSALNLNNNFGAYSSGVPSKSISTSKTKIRSQSASTTENKQFQGSVARSVAGPPIPKKHSVILRTSQIPRPSSRIPKPFVRAPSNQENWQDGCF